MHITPLFLEDCPQVAQLHQETFYRGWNEKDFQDFVKDPLIFGFKIEQGGDLFGYILWREVEGEAEILTLVIAPHVQRKGIGQQLLNALCERLTENGVSKLFLEVAEDNISAQNFYIKHGFVLLGKRDNYYLRKNSKHVSALSFMKVIE